MGRPEKGGSGFISRREFLTGGLTSAAAVGAMAFAPASQDSPLARALGPTTAYAREMYMEDGEEFVFEVVGVDEIGVHVVDPTKLDEKGDPVGVPNAIVILTSTDDPSIDQIQKHTDDDGKCVMNINRFCKKDEEGRPEDDIYMANVSVTITSDDGSICDYAVPSMLVTGTGAYRFAVEPYAGKPYLLSVAFNKQDILHDYKTFLRSPYNTYQYDICVRIKGVSKTTPVSLTFYRSSDTGKTSPLIGSPMSEDATLDDTGSFAEANFIGRYLCPDYDDGLPADDITIEVAVEGAFSSDILMKVVDAPSDAYEYPGPLNTLPCLPTMPFDIDIKLGDDKDKFGWFTNANVSMFTPPLPIIIYPTSCFVIAGFCLDAKLGKWSLPDNTPAPAVPGGDDPDEQYKGLSGDGRASGSSSNELLPWGYSVKSYDENWNKAVESDLAKLDNMFRNHANPVLDNGNPPNACRYSRFGAIEVDVIIQALFKYQWDGFKDGDYESKQYSQTGSLAVTVCVSGSYTWQFAAGPVPYFVTISAALSAGVGYTGEATHETIKLSDGTTAIDTDKAIDVWNQALSINFGIMFRVSAGAGISGVASIGVAATISFNPSLLFYEDGWEAHSAPHKYLPLTLRLELVFQFIFFKGSVTLLQYKDSWDSWDDDNWGNSSTNGLFGMDAWSGTEPRFALTHPGENSKRHTLAAIVSEDGRALPRDGEDPFASMVPVDYDMMSYSLEAKGTPRQGTTTEEYIATVHMDKLPCLAVRDDGSYGVELVDAPGHHAFVFGDVSLTGQADEETPEQGEEDAPQDAEQEVLDTQEAAAQDAGTSEDSLRIAVSEASDAEGSDLILDVQAEDGTALVAAASVAEVALVSDEVPADDVPADEAAPVQESQAEENLTAQADPEPTPNVLTVEQLNNEMQQANGEDPYRDRFYGLGKFVAEEYDYDYSEYKKTTGNPCEISGVKGIAPNDGIQPTSDTPIYEGVFSDARIKVVEIAGTMYQFRISTIEYAESTPCRRGRLTASKFNAETKQWENPVILEYSSGDPEHKRVDLCDYDFDIIARSSDDPWAQNVEACVVVISGTMGNNFYDSASNQMLNVLLIDKDLRVVQRAVRTASSFFDEEGTSYTLMAPRIADGFGLNGTSGALGISFLVRSAGDKTLLMSTAATVRLVLAQCFLVGDVLSLDFKTTIDDGGSNYMVLDTMVAELVMSASGDGSAGWMRILAKGGGCYEGWSAYMESGAAFNACRVMCNVPSTQETLPNIQPWNTHGTFLYVRDRSDTSAEGNTNDYYLYNGTFDLDTTQAALSEERVDRGALKGSSFCVSPDGKWLFYFESYQGDPDTAKTPEVPDPDPSLVITGKPDVGSDLYHMMASYLVDGKFCEDFVICDLDHPVDHFAVAGVSYNSASVFTTLEITDADMSIGTIRYLAIPYVAAVEIKAFMPSDEFIIAGLPGHFQIDVFNHGNIIVTGFTVTMHDEESGESFSYVVDTIEPDNIRVNATNGKWADSVKLGPSSMDGGFQPAQLTTLGLSEEAENGWLMPGKLMSYIVTYDIPEDWHDKRTVTMELSDYKYVEVKAVPEAPSADVVLPYYLGKTESAALMLFDNEANGVSHIYLPTTVYDESGDEPGGDTPGGGGGMLPKTGDPGTLANPVALAAGGFGALLAAYSVRRTQVEREESEE